MHKWKITYTNWYNRRISNREVQDTRFWYKWDMMDIGCIPPHMLISDIVQQNKAK